MKPAAWRVDYACGHSRFIEEYEEDPIACLMLDGGKFSEMVPLYTAPPDEVEALVEALRKIREELVDNFSTYRGRGEQLARIAALTQHEEAS